MITMKKERRTVGFSSAIGLEIGSRGVRAAELGRTRRGPAVRHLAEVPLAPGAVVDGEVREPGTVAVALRELWTTGGFSSRKVVLSISGPRVVVRQAEVAAMSAGDFASALQFQAADLIPLPIEFAVLDFSILPDEARTETGKMRVLLAAAHRDVIETQLGVLRDASLRAVAVDVAPMSCVRASERAAGPGTLGIVEMSDDLAVIAVREAGVLRFSRILTEVGDTPGRGSERGVVAPAPFGGRPPDAFVGGGVTPQALLTDGSTDGHTDFEAESVATKIIGSLSFFASQLDGGELDEVVVTGRFGLDPKLLTELERRLPSPVRSIDALEGLDLAAIELDVETRMMASANAFVPLGAAQWAFDSPSRRISLLPREMAAAAATRRRVSAGALAALVVVAALGAVTVHQRSQMSDARQAVARTTAANKVLSTQVRVLAPVSAAHTAVLSRLAVLHAAETGDIAWSQLLAEISSSMPAGTKLTNVSFTSAASGSASSGASASGSSATTSGTEVAGAIGTVSMSVTANGDEDQVAVWLRALRHVRGLTAVWVPSGVAASGVVTFTSNASITDRAPMVARHDSGGAQS